MSYIVCWLMLTISGVIICVPTERVDTLLTGMFFTAVALFAHWLSYGRRRKAA